MRKISEVASVSPHLRLVLEKARRHGGAGPTWFGHLLRAQRVDAACEWHDYFPPVQVPYTRHRSGMYRHPGASAKQAWDTALRQLEALRGTEHDAPLGASTSDEETVDVEIELDELDAEWVE